MNHELIYSDKFNEFIKIIDKDIEDIHKKYSAKNEELATDVVFLFLPEEEQNIKIQELMQMAQAELKSYLELKYKAYTTEIPIGIRIITDGVK